MHLPLKLSVSVSTFLPKYGTARITMNIYITKIYARGFILSSSDFVRTLCAQLQDLEHIRNASSITST